MYALHAHQHDRIDFDKIILQKMMEQATKSKSSSELRRQMDIILAYVKDQLTKYLLPFNKGPTLHELFVFDDVKSVRHHIMGSPRAVVHSALQNPNLYLQVINFLGTIILVISCMFSRKIFVKIRKNLEGL